MKSPPKVLVAAILALVAFAAPSTASASGPPIVTTGVASDITNKTATLNGTVNPNGLETHYAFEWGTTTAYGSGSWPTSVGSGTSPVSVRVTLPSLRPNTIYHYRVVGVNSAGYSLGEDRTFRTGTVTLVNGRTDQPLSVSDPIYGEITSLQLVSSSSTFDCPGGDFAATVLSNQGNPALVAQNSYVNFDFSGKCYTGMYNWLTLAQNSFSFSPEDPMQFFSDGTANFDSGFGYTLLGNSCTAEGSGTESWTSTPDQPTVVRFNQSVSSSPSGSCWVNGMSGNFALTTTGGDPVEILVK